MSISTSSVSGLQTHSLSGLRSFEMVRVEGGSFMMGDEESGNKMEQPHHEVELSDYWIGQYPVTQDLWQAVMGENPSFFEGMRRPVEQVSWYDCVEFCNALSKKQQLEPVYIIDKNRKDPNNKNSEDWDNQRWLVRANHAANGYRLPTEAEWEYAARGGRYARGFAYAGSNDLNEVGWYNKNSHRTTWPVGQKRPNELGLFDLSGNVWEWCWDWYGPYMDAYMHDPTGDISGEGRVLRGGCWIRDAGLCRVASRRSYWPHDRGNLYGLRLSRTASGEGN